MLFMCFFRFYDVLEKSSLETPSWFLGVNICMSVVSNRIFYVVVSVMGYRLEVICIGLLCFIYAKLP
jgi:hypothetical protein